MTARPGETSSSASVSRGYAYQAFNAAMASAVSDMRRIVSFIEAAAMTALDRRRSNERAAEHASSAAACLTTTKPRCSAQGHCLIWMPGCDENLPGRVELLPLPL